MKAVSRDGRLWLVGRFHAQAHAHAMIYFEEDYHGAAALVLVVLVVAALCQTELGELAVLVPSGLLDLVVLELTALELAGLEPIWPGLAVLVFAVLVHVLLEPSLLGGFVLELAVLGLAGIELLWLEFV